MSAICSTVGNLDDLHRLKLHDHAELDCQRSARQGGVLLHLLLVLQVGDVRGVVESLSQGHRDCHPLMS